MRTTIGLAIVLIGGALGLVGASGRKEAPQPPAPSAARQPLVVHEWGTFTNFSGSNGIQLEFRPLVDHELPPFVYNLAWETSNPWSKSQLVARQRMETPVTYFYSDEPRDLTVSVGFPQGLLTEFYPPATKMSAPHTGIDGALANQPLTSVPPLSNSSLTWKITARPDGAAAKSEQRGRLPDLPHVAGDDHYSFARDTDSDVVLAVDSAGIQHAEKFLFYRGIGNFSLPLRLEALTGRRFRLVNDGPDAIGSLFFVMIDEQGLHFCEHPGVTANAELEAVVPDATATSEDLGNRMARALVAAGLFEKEAAAMIRTWQSSWFSEPGARLFYLVPRRLTDEIIPLRVEPSPDEMVRVLVGRMETLTPEAADRLSSVILDLGTCLSSDAEPWHSELDRFGRFAEPVLAYLKDRATDAATRDAIERLTRQH